MSIGLIKRKKVAILSDFKALGTNGGTATLGAWRDLDLNDLVDPDSIVTSLIANKFILPAGKYKISMWSLGYKLDTHRATIKGDGATGLLDDEAGSNFSNDANSNTCTMVSTSALLDLSVAEGFNAQYQSKRTLANNGLGVAGSFSGSLEKYREVVIEKLT